MKVRIDPNGYEISQKGKKRMIELVHDLETIFAGENRGIVMNVLINMYMHPYVQDGRTKEDLLKDLGQAFDKIKASYERREK
jgi:hypothetical protein